MEADGAARRGGPATGGAGSGAGAPERIRRRYLITGVVQGVGMRPFLARLAGELQLSGICRNTSTTVEVEVEGPGAAVAAFGDAVRLHAPPLAVLDDVLHEDLPASGGSGFVIASSAGDRGPLTLVGPDTAPCPDCLREFADPADRRYRHPFITCTNCGPRYTITLDLPYDRPSTTMAGFPLCARCAAEYADPADRRYHAQPIGCHDCGPRLALHDGDEVVATELDEVVSRARRALADGAILAVKGLGGYHLACDAGNAAAVARLRERKRRPDQPFAVMAADLPLARRAVHVSTEAERQLTSQARPIVLLPRRGPARDLVCADVAPRLDELGVMLPYTPVHQLLFEAPEAPRLLVMTSGNRSGEPLCVEDGEALDRLAGIADLWLTHDRPIAVPCEDSVVALDAADRPVPVRRSRGFAPLPVRLPSPADPGEPAPVVLAVGADLKNTFTLVRDGLAFVSAHIGDLGTLENQSAHGRSVEQALRFHRSQPDLVVADSHPGYASRSWAVRRSEAWSVPLREVQHHHAHLASLAAERGRLAEPLVGLVFDGTGYGCDATIWGGELLALRDAGAGCDRLGHLATLPLPGGDAGVRNPVRTAAAALLTAGVDLAGTPVAAALTPAEHRLLGGLLRAARPGGGVGWVPTSSVGRLFDVVSSLLGVCHRVSYEGQAAIELQALAQRWAAGQEPEPAGRDPASPGPALPEPADVPVLAWDALLRWLADAVRGGAEAGDLAWRFHVWLAESSARLAVAGLVAQPGVGGATGPAVVGLTGGVFQNRLLTRLTIDALSSQGITALTHRLVPPNDGGISLGQAAIGSVAGSAALGTSSP